MTERRSPPILPPDLAGELAAGLPAPALDAGTRERLRARVLAAAQTPATAVLRADEGEWRQAFVGIRIKTLRRDPVAGTETSLWRLAPGARVPRHVHRLEEECLVLEGSVEYDGEVYQTGDYVLAAPHARHAPFTTRTGALLLIRGETVPRLGWLSRLAIRLSGL
jgi:quercetin dioxygenase-like cupin family protein